MQRNCHFWFQLYNAAARDLAKTCPLCIQALDAFDAQFAGDLLSDALVKYGNMTLHLLRHANDTLGRRDFHKLPAVVNASSLLAHSSELSSQGAELGSLAAIALATAANKHSLGC